MSEKAITKDNLKQAQAKSKSKSQQDLVSIEILKDGNFYRKGDKDKVHPTVAEILKVKGLIK
jgi:biopolymer transport protein ExbD